MDMEVVILDFFTRLSPPLKTNSITLLFGFAFIQWLVRLTIPSVSNALAAGNFNFVLYYGAGGSSSGSSLVGGEGDSRGEVGVA